MKIAVLHSSNQGFFPRFFEDLTSAVDKFGDQIVAFAPVSGNNLRRKLDRQILWGNRLNWFIHYRLYKLTGLQDIFSFFSTLDLIHKLRKYNPDVFHLNVMNEWNICIPLFTHYLNKTNKPILWTFHDCRVFTGGCPFFDEIGCEEWKSGCAICPIKQNGGSYSVGKTGLQWKIRKRFISSLKNLHVVTPSKWMATYVKESFLKNHPCNVLYNGVDIDTLLKPLTIDVRNKYGLVGKTIILGCAVNWEPRKGLVYFENMANKLPANYAIVLVGGIPQQEIDRLQKKGILVVGRTNSFEELIAWYQQSNVFVNPTLADNFPTVNIEALGAGLPVVTFKTGGSAESIDESCGKDVEKGDENALYNAIIDVCENTQKYSKDNCINRSKEFSLMQFDKYVKLYHSF